MSVTGKNSDESSSHWMSISDMMTGLMVIFMFVAIAFMIDVIEDKRQQDIIFEEFKAVQEKLYNELQEEFEDDFESWDMMLDGDLSIRFTNADVLFESGSYEITNNFGEILDQFLPRYFDVLRKMEYRDKIREIRIEGHSDNDPIYRRGYSSHPYIGNVQLSQERARAVMKHFMVGEYYKELKYKERNQIEYWLTANGLSYGNMLNTDGKPYQVYGGKRDAKKSRRVEFRIVTAMDEVFESMLNLTSN